MINKLFIPLLLLSCTLLVPLTALGMELQKTRSSEQGTPTQHTLQELARQQQLLLIDLQEKTKYFEGSYKPSYELFVRKNTDSLKTYIHKHPQPQILKEYLLRTACELNHGKFIEFLHREIIDINSSINPIFTLQRIQSSPVIPTPLHMACEAYKIETIKFLLNLGANIEAQNSLGSTPLHMACEVGREDVVQLLIKQKANIHSKDISEYTPFHVACQKGHMKIVELLHKCKADIHDTRNNKGNALWLAAFHGKPEVAQFLIKQGIDYHGSNIDIITPLHCACLSGNTKTVELLINKNPDSINAQMFNGATPLHIACAFKNVEIVRILLKCGADITIENDMAITALDYAYDQENEEIIGLLEQQATTKKKKKQRNKNKKSSVADQPPQATLPLPEPENYNNTLPPEPTIVEQSAETALASKTNAKESNIAPLYIEPNEQNTPQKGISSPPPISAVTKKSNPATKIEGDKEAINQPPSVNAVSKKTDANKEQIISSLEESTAYEVLCKKNLRWPKGLDEKIQSQLLEKMKALRHGTEGSDVKKLKGGNDLFKLRYRGYRIIFSWDTTAGKIYIHKISLRKGAYKFFKKN